jgi:hypothetical protein
MRALLALAVLFRVAAIAEPDDDVFDLPALERRFDDCIERLRTCPDPLFPVDLEEEALSSLTALARLNGESAALRARETLAVTASSGLAWAARKVLSREGDGDTIRSALLSYFEDEERFRAVLAESDDPRLLDFRRDEPLEPAPSPRLFRSSLEWNLSRARSRAAVRALVLWAESSTDVDSPRRVLSAMEKGTPYDARIERWLAQNPAEGRREEAPTRPPSARPMEERGRALAAVVLSTTAGIEEKRFALSTMRDVWEEALALPAPGLAEAMIELAGERETLELVEATTDPATLAALPLPEARLRLEELGTAEAIESLMKRPDRFASLPFLERARRSSDPNAARAADLALLSLGAPGATAFVRRELAAGTDLEDLLRPVSLAPIDPALILDVVRGPAGWDSPSPAGFAALVSFQERYPASFFAFLSGLSGLAGKDGSLAERAQVALSLSKDSRRIPLLVDIAAGGTESSWRSREAAFAALAEADLGPFAARLHRLAGDPDRAIRFRAAAALVPAGEAWPLRLLLASIDESSPRERRAARGAVERLTPERAVSLLGDLVSDQTAGSFGVVLFLDLGGTANHAALWTIVEDDALSGGDTALLAASRLEDPRAIRCVTRFLTARESAW